MMKQSAWLMEESIPEPWSPVVRTVHCPSAARLRMPLWNSVRPGAFLMGEVQVIFIGNFNDAQKAYDLTKTAIENGANVVYNVAGPAGLGILKGAADAGKYAIGVDSDQNGLHPDNVIASMLKQIGNSIYDSIGQVRDGKAEFGKLKIYGLANEGVGLVYNDKLVPDAIKAKVDQAKAKVVKGELKVDTAFK